MVLNLHLYTDLARIHLKFANDLDGHFAQLARGVLCSVHIAEGTISHFLQESPSLQSGIFWQFALTLPFLGYDAFNDRGVQVFVPSSRARIRRSLLVLLIPCGPGSSRVRLCHHVALVHVGRRVVPAWVMRWDGPMVQDGVTYPVVDLGGRRSMPLWLSMDGRNIGGRVPMRVRCSSLLTMADEIL